MSNRLDDWLSFGGYVSKHIEEYTVPQYGDKPDDQASEFTIEECLAHVKRYINRYGKNQRGRDDQEKDFYKMAQYVQIAWDKWMDANCDGK
jgi:hypothetical protein